MDTLLLILFLQIKHWYADFVIQSYMQTVKKGVWLHPVGISHSAEHLLSTYVALLIFDLTIAPLNVLTVILVGLAECIIHYFVDFVKVKYGIKDMTKPLFWNQFGQDQLAHQATYLAMAAILLHI
jgi:hypothetical protein